MKNISFFSIRAPNENGKGDQIALYQRCKLLSRNPEIEGVRVYYFFGALSKNLGNQVVSKKLDFFSIRNILMIPWLYFVCGFPLQSTIFYSYHMLRTVKTLPKDEVIWVMTLRLSYLLNTPHRTIMDFIDAISLGYNLKSQNAKLVSKKFYENEAKRLLRHESNISLKNSTNILVSTEDQKLEHFKSEHTFWLPLYLNESLKPQVRDGRRKSFVFHGTLNYPPNNDSVTYLLNDILPLYRDKYGDCRIRILGRNPSKKLVALIALHDNVELLADCENIFDELQSEASIYIAPLRLGSGMQNKLLEAARLKIPIITSTKAAMPLGLLDQSTCLVASSAEEYASNMNLLMIDCSLADKIAENAHDYVEAAFNFNNVADKLRLIIEGDVK